MNKKYAYLFSGFLFCALNIGAMHKENNLLTSDIVKGVDTLIDNQFRLILSIGNKAKPDIINELLKNIKRLLECKRFLEGSTPANRKVKKKLTDIKTIITCTEKTLRQQSHKNPRTLSVIQVLEQEAANFQLKDADSEWNFESLQ